ncbi:MAG: TrkH family potassium uptake protein [Desulfobacterales bacterium]
MTFRSRLLKLHPATLVFASFLIAILAGTLVLKLPVSTKTGEIHWIDAVFTATSAICVTGLIVVDTGGFFTAFGQGVILFLIQIGGVGVITFAVMLFRFIRRNISIRQRMAVQDMFAHTPREDILKLLKNIVLVTFLVEAVGAVLLTFCWIQDFPFYKAVYVAIFHSVSAFCNAGFSLFSDSLMHYTENIYVNVIICSLIVIGGIGFPVLYDLKSSFKNRKKKRFRLSIQTKVVLLTTLILIAAGAFLFFVLERHKMEESQSIPHYILVSVFQSITSRTAGFNTVDIAQLQEATLALIIFLMFFGASPGSAGGGVKTTTLAIITAFMICRIRHQRRVNMFKKSIPPETVSRSISLVLLSIGIISLVLFFILAGDAAVGREVPFQQRSFITYLFETVSAFGTVGLSMGVTPMLSTWGKFWIILMMIIGRVGVLTFAYIIVGAGLMNGIEYSEENLMVG